MLRWLVLILALLVPELALAQGAVQQGGPWTQGRAPMYIGNGSFGNAVIMDSGPAGGGSIGIGMSEGLYVAQGTGAAPFSGQGTGPLGTNVCDYDAPITNATGFHYLCFSPNISGNLGAIVYGNSGLATAQPLTFNVDGVQQFALSALGTNFTAPIIFNGVLPSGPGAQTLCETSTGVLSFSCVSGGGGNPGGANLSVQYNNAGAFAGVPVLANGFLITNGAGSPNLGTQINLTTASSLVGATMPVFVSGGAIDQATVGTLVAGTGISITGTTTVTIALAGTLSGAGSVFATSTGALGNGDCVSINNGNFVDAGGPCTTSGGGGTVSAGLINQLAYYASAGTAVSGLATAASGVLVTSAGSVPSISSTLPSALTIPSPTITGTATIAAANFTGAVTLPSPTITGTATIAAANFSGAVTFTGSLILPSPTITGTATVAAANFSGIVALNGATSVNGTATGGSINFPITNNGTSSTTNTNAFLTVALSCANCSTQVSALGGPAPIGQLATNSGLTGGMNIQSVAGPITMTPATSLTINGAAPTIAGLVSCVGIKTNGAGLTSCATAVAPTYVNVTLNGLATGNSASTNTTALNALITSVGSAGGCLYFPAGVYQVTTLAATALTVCITGDDPRKTKIQTTIATGDVFTFTGMYQISNIGFNFSAVGHRTSGAYIHSQAGGNNAQRLQDVWLDGCFWCIDTTDNVLSYDNLYFEMTLATSAPNEVFVRSHGCGGGCRFSHLFNAAFAGTFPQAGLFVDATPAGNSFVLTDTIFLTCQHGIEIAPSANPVLGFMVANNLFDTSQGDAILIHPTGTGSVLAGKFSNNWTSSAAGGGSGIHLVTVAGTTISSIEFVTQQSTNNGSAGAVVDGSAGGTLTKISFIGGTYNNNGTSGILTNTVTQVRVIGVDASSNASAGISINSGNHAVVTGNNVVNNTVLDIFNGAAAPIITSNNVCTSTTC